MRRVRYSRQLRRKFFWVALLCLGIVQLSGPRAFAQVDQGAITGFVQDATGAVIANEIDKFFREQGSPES